MVQTYNTHTHTHTHMKQMQDLFGGGPECRVFREQLSSQLAELRAFRLTILQKESWREGERGGGERERSREVGAVREGERVRLRSPLLSD